MRELVHYFSEGLEIIGKMGITFVKVGLGVDPLKGHYIPGTPIVPRKGGHVSCPPPLQVIIYLELHLCPGREVSEVDPTAQQNRCSLRYPDTVLEN